MIKSISIALAPLLIGDAAQAREPVSPVPATNPGSWVTTEDYPPASLRTEEQGTTGFEVTVDVNGLVGSCLTTKTSGYEALDTATCALITDRARFKPATDKRGRPTAGVYRSSVRWVIPEGEPGAPPTPGKIMVSFTVNADGSVSDCVGSVEGNFFGQRPPKGDGCPTYREEFQPYTDSAGNPVRKRVTLLMSTTVEDVP